MATASWRTCWGYDGMRPPKFHPNRFFGSRVVAFRKFCNMAAVRHLEFEFCYSGPPTKSAMWFTYPVKIWCRSNLPRWRYRNFIILWKMPNHAPFWVFLGGFEPIKIVGRHPNPQKAHPWVRTHHLSHKWLKSVHGFELGVIARKKVGQDSKKCNISHIWGQAPRKAIAMKFVTWVDVHEIVTWAQFDL